MKKIPFKNYICAFLITIMTLFVVFNLIEIYNNNNKIDFMTEVKEEELQQYIVENNNIFIYFSKGNNKKIEDELEKYLENNEIKNDIIFVNLDKVSKDFELKFNSSYKEVTSSVYYNLKNPTIVSIKSGKIVNYLNKLNNIDDIKQFIERNTND